MPSVYRSGLAVACCLLTATAQANLVVNGDFESPALSSGYGIYSHGQSIDGWLVYGSGGTTAPVLSIRSDDLEYTGTLAFSPHGGLIALDLTGAANQGRTA
jgi:hypothetical protein